MARVTQNSRRLGLELAQALPLDHTLHTDGCSKLRNDSCLPLQPQMDWALPRPVLLEMAFRWLPQPQLLPQMNYPRMAVGQWYVLRILLPQRVHISFANSHRYSTNEIHPRDTCWQWQKQPTTSLLGNIHETDLEMSEQMLHLQGQELPIPVPMLFHGDQKDSVFQTY